MRYLLQFLKVACAMEVFKSYDAHWTIIDTCSEDWV